MPTAALLLGLALLGQTEVPGCGDPPSIASSAFWDHIAACGCAKTVPPSRASLDYDRYLQACAQWRRENPQVNVFVANPSPNPPSSPTPQPSSSPSASPKPTPSPRPTPKPSPTPKPLAVPDR
jgi:hypothetical protein